MSFTHVCICLLLQKASSRDAKDTLAAELAGLEEERAALATQIDTSTRTREHLEGTAKDSEQRWVETEKRFASVRDELAKRKEQLAAYDARLGQLAQQQSALADALSENDVQARSLGHKIQRHNAETEATQRGIEHMMREYEWIRAESQFFGKAHTDYDFAATNPDAVRRELATLMAEQQKLEGTINKKVASMISEADRKYQVSDCGRVLWCMSSWTLTVQWQDLQEHKAKVEQNKAQIHASIDELDRKKVEALEATFMQVNRDFGTLYAKFLPGVTATLSKVNGDILSGLEMNVCFGNVWKDSLTELSGGQRSLMALSLILALCRYKAAPLYILDEIDAALDPSHTENIGDIISSEFSNSQFVVVSLKEGFYRNCNALFEVELDESIQSSRVKRTVKGGKASQMTEPAMAKEGGGGKKRK